MTDSLVVHEVRRQIAAVELHPLNDVHLRVGGLAFLDGDDSILGPDLLHRLGQLLTDLPVVVGGDGGHLGDRLVVLGVDRLGELVQFIDDLFDALLDAAGEGHRVVPGGDRLEPLAEDEFREHGGGGGAVAGHVGGLAGRFLDELRPHVLEGVLQLDVFGDGDAVLGDVR